MTVVSVVIKCGDIIIVSSLKNLGRKEEAMKKECKVLLAIMCVAVLGGCSSKKEYSYKQYDDYYKGVQKALIYEDDEKNRSYTLTMSDWGNEKKIVYTKDDNSTILAIYSAQGQGDAFYTQKDKDVATLEYNGCTVAYDSEKEVGNGDCTSKKLDRISKDKKEINAYLEKQDFDFDGLKSYCGDYIEKNQDKAVEKHWDE